LIYQYKCECGEEFEKMLSTYTPEYKCPKCGKLAKKQLKTFNFRLFKRIG